MTLICTNSIKDSAFKITSSFSRLNDKSTSFTDPGSQKIVSLCSSCSEICTSGSYGWPYGFFLDQVVWVLGPLTHSLPGGKNSYASLVALLDQIRTFMRKETESWPPFSLMDGSW